MKDWKITYGYDCSECRHNLIRGNPERVQCEILEAGERGIIRCGDDGVIVCERYEA